MAQWVDVSYDFGQPIARIRIGMRGLVMRGLASELSRSFEAGPAILRKFMERLITDAHPQMTGLRIVAMEMRQAPVTVDVLVTHENLRSTRLNDEPPQLMLWEDGVWSSNYASWESIWEDS